MDYGDLLIGTFELMSPARAAAKPPAGSLPDYVAPDANLAYKAIALRLDAGDGGIARGRVWAAFEHDTLRFAGAWSGAGFIDWHGINFDGRHVVRPRTIGTLAAETALLNSAEWRRRIRDKSAIDCNHSGFNCFRNLDCAL